MTHFRDFHRIGRRVTRILACVLCIVLGVQVARAGDSAATAKRVVESLRSKKGIAFDIGCGDAGLAIGIAKQSELTVYCMDPDEKTVQAARKAIDAAGLYGARVSAKQIDLKKLPLPDVCANLVICGDGFVNGKGSRDFKEIYRILSPNGVAFIGQSAASGAKGKKLERGELEGWLKEAGITTYTIMEEDGVWARITRPPLPGADEWTHRSHDCSNTHGSKDTAVVPPFRIQWATAATATLGNSMLLLAGGREFVVSYTHKDYPAESAPAIHVYDAYNGTLIWSRVGTKELPIDRNFGHYSPMHVSSEAVATADALYVTGGKECVVFDAETGEIRKSMAFPEGVEAGDNDIWQYIALSDGLLLAALGPAPPLPKKKFGKYEGLLKGASHTLCVMDAGTGSVKWKGAHKALVNSLAVGGGRVYFVDQDMVLHALDFKTGEKAWSGTASVFPPETVPKRTVYFRDKLWLMGVGDGASARYVGHGNIVAKSLPVFSAKDGRHLFDPELPMVAGTDENKKRKGPVDSVAFLAFTKDFAVSSGVPKVMVDAETGKARWRKKLKGGSCSAPLAITPKYYFGKFGGVETATGKSARFGALRACCHMPPLPANGMVYVPAPGCECGFGFRANAAVAPGKIEKDVPDTQRLVKGPAHGQDVPKDEKPVWAGWRADAARLGILEGTVSVPLKQAWSVSMNVLTTPVSVGGGVVMHGGADHKLVGRDPATGKQKWQYIAEGDIRIPPWLSKGRVYIGDDDGWVHCVRVSDGALIWKFRAALGKARVIVNGRMNSRWRAGCGVLVVDGIAYFTAGFFPVEGTATYGLDAVTGELKKKWTPERSGYPASGMLAFGNDTLYIGNEWEYARGLKVRGKDEGKMKLFGGRTRGTPRGGHIMAIDDRLLLRSPDFQYVNHVVKFVDSRGTLPIITEASVYMNSGWWMMVEDRGTFRSLEKTQSYYKGTARFRPNGGRGVPVGKEKLQPHGSVLILQRHRRLPTEKSLRWKAWTDQRMTAAIMVGDVILSGGIGKVFATAAKDGKELWSAEVPGHVTDVAFHDGKVYAVCRKPDAMVCFAGEK